jgi:hypothetical protein
MSMQRSLDRAVEEALAITTLLMPRADENQTDPATVTGDGHLLDWISRASAEVIGVSLPSLSSVIPDGHFRRDY